MFLQQQRRLLLMFLFLILVVASPSMKGIQVSSWKKCYKQNYYTWPLPETKYVPNTTEWIHLMKRRIEQIENIPHSPSQEQQRYNAFIHIIKQATMTPNFTEYGFALTRAPEALTEEIRDQIKNELVFSTVREEEKVNIIDGPPSLFIDRPDLVEKALHTLQPYMEAWSSPSSESAETHEQKQEINNGMNQTNPTSDQHMNEANGKRRKVVPKRGYGFRLYQNGNSLMMHTDKYETHILGMIYHIDRSDDAQPWPLYIEEFKHGNTYEIYLTPGDVLMYESSKCLHGRPKPLEGSWYTSLFLHYYPADNWDVEEKLLEAECIVPPPHWIQQKKTKTSKPIPKQAEQESTSIGKQGEVEKLQMIGRAMMEPNCPYQWCATKTSIKWYGPGEEGFYITPNFEKHPLFLDGINNTKVDVDNVDRNIILKGVGNRKELVSHIVSGIGTTQHDDDL